MVIYLKHNLKGNILSADGKNDVEMKNNIILSEVGKLISVRPGLVIAYLRASGIKVGNASRSSLVTLVARTIPNNPKFTGLLAEEIVGNGRAPRNYINANTPAEIAAIRGDFNINLSQMDPGAVNIAKALADFFGRNTPNPRAKGLLQQQTDAIHSIAVPGSGKGSKLIMGILFLAGGIWLIKTLS